LQLYPRRQFLKTAAAGALTASPWLSLACGFFDQFDLLIIGGLIYDGSGRPGIIADMGIKNGKIAALGNPHPRNFGTFPRLLGKYGRKEKLFTPAEALRKITSLPATARGIKNRGLIEIGNYADVVIFDSKQIVDRATWTAPHQYPAGIRFGIVNGGVAIDDGEFTGKLAGRVLRAPF